MKIAQIAPLYESVPPQKYGGTERVVSYLTEELVRAGHEVTLFASGDSSTRARLCPMCDRALRLHDTGGDPIARHLYMAERVCQQAARFDVVHSHMDYLAFPFLRRTQTPHVSTFHGRLDQPSPNLVYREYAEEPVVSISNHQRLPHPLANWQATVYHGLPPDRYRGCDRTGDYLLFLGRISPEKRLDHAIEVALRSGVPLKIAAKVEKTDRDYFEASIKPRLASKGVEYIGEIGEEEKQELLGGALALLMIIDWPEPFGLVMIEAMACGTPVIARRRGSVPEVIESGVTGYVVRDVSEAVRAVGKVRKLSRKRCREEFEQRFTSARMARDYLAVYEQLISAQSVQPFSTGILA